MGIYRKNDTIIFRVHLKSISTDTFHPKASKSILEYRCITQWSAFSFTVQIMGHSLGVLFTSGPLGNSEYERLVVWDWASGVQRAVSSVRFLYFII
jgi:hypothetical protein